MTKPDPTAGHTETPWYIAHIDGDTYIARGVNMVARMFGPGDVPRPMDANAAFIVRAVNDHDGLVGQLTSLCRCGHALRAHSAPGGAGCADCDCMATLTTTAHHDALVAALRKCVGELLGARAELELDDREGDAVRNARAVLKAAEEEA